MTEATNASTWALFGKAPSLWDPARVITSREGWLVVHKPADLPVQGAALDLVRCVRTVCSQPLLVPVDTLAKDVSGLVILATNRKHHASMTADLQQSSVRTHWYAMVHRWKHGASGILENTLVADREGMLKAARPSVRGASLGRLRFTCVDHTAETALLAIESLEGPRHHVRAQLALAGSPIVGDVRYGAESASRVMLDLHSIELPDPVTGTVERISTGMAPHDIFPLETTAPWWTNMRESWLRVRLRDAASRRLALFAENTSNAWRLVNDVADGLPGLTIDRYGTHAVVQCYDPGVRAALDVVCTALREHGAEGVYVKYRPKQSNTLVTTRREDIAPREPIAGTAAPSPMTIIEQGVNCIVALGDGLSTGIFLDQRANRAWLQQSCNGRTVLNLFAYTSVFSVCAVAAGATLVTSVDASSGALEWARQNAVANGQELTRHRFVCADVFGWLEGALARGDRYDIVILDPPSYSNVKNGERFSSGDDYGDLARKVLGLLSPAGQLLACTNHRKTSLRRFVNVLSKVTAESLAGCTLEARTTPLDFPAFPNEDSHLKSVVVTSGSRQSPAERR